MINFILVKDVEANAEEKEFLGKILKPRSRFCSFRKFGPVAQMVKRMMKRKIRQFNGRSKYWNYYWKRHWIFCFRRFREYKGEEVQVSNGRYGPYIRHGAAFVSLPKEKIL
jgi:DNA topoisomerase-1